MKTELTKEQENLIDTSARYMLSAKFHKSEFETVVNMIVLQTKLSATKVKTLLKKRIKEVLLEDSKAILELFEVEKVKKKTTVNPYETQEETGLF